MKRWFMTCACILFVKIGCTSSLCSFREIGLRWQLFACCWSALSTRCTLLVHALFKTDRSNRASTLEWWTQSAVRVTFHLRREKVKQFWPSPRSKHGRSRPVRNGLSPALVCRHQERAYQQCHWRGLWLTPLRPHQEHHHPAFTHKIVVVPLHDCEHHLTMSPLD